MTDQTSTDTTEGTADQTPEADATPPDTAAAVEVGESDTDDDYQGNDPKIARAFKDAKRYRLQLRDTETERDQLATTLDGTTETRERRYGPVGRDIIRNRAASDLLLMMLQRLLP